MSPPAMSFDGGYPNLNLLPPMDHDSFGDLGKGAKAKAKLCARGHWRPAEDAKLKDLVAQYGPQNWNLIADNLQGRSGKSCRLRWFNQLDPRINRKAFSEEEEERLLSAHRLYGNKWALIARLFPGRTDNAVKNHWHVIMARKQRDQSSSIFRRRRNGPNHNNNIISNANCASDSANSTSRDHESASTCTDLSLTPTPPSAPFFTRFSPNRHPLIAKTGLSGGSGLCQSYSNSQGSFNDSLDTTNGVNQSSSLENEHHNSHKVTFFDFLGVGGN